MPATFNVDDCCSGIAAQHLARQVGWQQVRIRTADNEDRHFDRRPIFPKVETVVPWVPEGADDLRVAEHDVALALFMPCDAVAGNMAPMLIRQISKGRQDFSEIG